MSIEVWDWSRSDGGHYARVAGKVTKRLEEQGRAFYGRRGWEVFN